MQPLSGWTPRELLLKLDFLGNEKYDQRSFDYSPLGVGCSLFRSFPFNVGRQPVANATAGGGQGGRCLRVSSGLTRKVTYEMPGF